MNLEETEYPRGADRDEQEFKIMTADMLEARIKKRVSVRGRGLTCDGRVGLECL